jgi:RNA polymerase sigma-70 factor (ECF subfamily)
MTDFDAEFARHHRAAFGWALACCAWDRNIAEDVLQTAYLKVIDGRARFAGQGEFRAFLFGVIRRTASEEGRRHALVRWALPLSALIGQPSEPSVPHASAGRADESAALIAALGALATRQREVLVLVFYHDLTIAAAAEVLGVSIGSARTHYERGKAGLRQLLGKE